MPIYKLNGETYDIPNDVVADFEKDNPNATVTYFTNGDEYEIPVSERDGFLTEFPDATTEKQAPGPGSTKQPMMDAQMKQAADTPKPAAAPAKESKQGGYQPSWQDMMGFQQTIGNAGFAAGVAAPSFEKKASNLQKRQGLNVPKRVNVGETNNLVEGEQYLNPETGKLEQTYITSQGNEYDNKAGAEAEQRQIDDYERKMRYATGKGMDDLSDKYITPMVDDAMRKAEDEWLSSMKEGLKNNKTNLLGDGMEMEVLRNANEEVDPDKILQGLQKSLESAYKNPEMQKEISRLAESIGMSKEDYLGQIVAPSLAARLENAFASKQIAKNMPKNASEYILQGLGSSIFGMLMDAATETKGQRAYKNQAEALTEQGENPYYNPGTGAKLSRMGVSFAADAPFFGVYGRVSGQVAKNIAQRQISKMMAKGLSENAARSIVGTALENSVGARMKNYLMQHVVSSSLTMGGYNATSELARQIRDKEGVDLGRIAGSTVEGLATGAAFGVTGGVTQALSQPLSGISKIGAKVAGYGAEAETMYATEELAKLAHGEEAFTNPFEGSAEAMMKLGVMKLSGGHLLESAGKKLIRAKEVGGKQVAAETLAGLLGPNRTGVKFTPEEQDYIRNSAEGRNLVEALSQMHPEIAISEVNGKKRLTKDGEALRQQLADNYNAFMGNTEIPASTKQKVAHILGGLYRPGLETGADIIHNPDGSVILKTRDKDGNCIQDLKFDSFSDAEQWREDHTAEFRLNDAVNGWNGTTEENRRAAVTDIAETFGVSWQDAKDMVYKALDDKDTSLDRDQYNMIFDAINRNAYPEDEYNPKRRYQEGKQVDTIERHKVQTNAQLKEEKLRLLGDKFAEEVIAAADYPDEKMAELASSDYFTKEQIEAARDYYNAIAKVRGMMDEALKGIDEQVEAENARVRRNVHTDSGSLIEASYRGGQYYITAGHFQLSPDGKLVPTDNSGLVILRDKNTGEIVTANPNDVMASAIYDPNRVIAENESMEGLRGQLMKEADDTIELHPDTPETPQEAGETFVGADGKTYMVNPIPDESGNIIWTKVEANLDDMGNVMNIKGEPQPLDIEEYRKAKSDEKDAAEIPPEEAAAIVENQNVQVDENSLGKGAEGVGSTPDASEAVNIDVSDGEGGGTDVPPSQTEEPRPASSRIPVDEKGKKIYEQAKPEDTLSELTGKYGEEKAREMISKIAESSTRELEKLQQTDTSGMTDMAELEAHEDKIAEAKRKADYWQQFLKEEKPAEPEKPAAEPEHPTEPQAPVEPEKPVEPETPKEPEKPVEPEKPKEPETPQPQQLNAWQKIAQGTVKNNIGKRFELQNQDGTRSEIVINSFKGDDMVEVTRQDYDSQGQPKGDPYSQDLNMFDVGNAIGNSLKPVLSVEERLRNAFKGKVGMQNIIDVLTEEEQRRILDAFERKDNDALNELTREFLETHREDIILNERGKRNVNVARIIDGGGSREDKLRRVRKEFQGYDDAVLALSDEALQPTTLEEYIADLHSRQPKSGEGPLAYFSYDQDGRQVVGMQDETGYGKKTGGDTKGFAPWLAPKGKGMSLQQYSEMIHGQLPESIQQQYSDQDVRNAILSVFGGAERPSDITTMVIKRGIVQAEQAARRMEEQWIDGGLSYQKVADENSFVSRLRRVKESVNTEPTEAQKEAGNYKKGHISFGGYDFTVENPEGSIRRGKDATGREWEQKMNNTYGYILGKFGKDGDHLDMFINDAQDLDNWNGNVYVVDQVDPKTGKFDEHKILYGFDSLEEAKKAYLSNYEKGWQGLGRITGVTKEGFDLWLDSSKRKLKEFANHSIAKEHMVEREGTSFDSALKQLDQREISIDNPDLLKEYGLKNVVLSRTGDHLTLTHFIAAEQGKGNGTRFMEDLARLADEKGWTLALTPGLGFGAKSKKKLEEFYKRFGFVANKGRNADFQTREAMIRRPKEFMEKPENQEKVIRDAVVEYLKSIGIDVSTEWKLGQRILDEHNRRLEANEESEEQIKSQKATTIDISDGNAMSVDMRKPIEETIPRDPKINEALNIKDRVDNMTPEELIENYKRINSQMLDENGLNVDELEDIRRREYISKHGVDKGFGKAMADHLKMLSDKYGYGKLCLRWDLLDRIKELGLEDYLGYDKPYVTEKDTAKVYDMHGRPKLFKTSDGYAYGYTYKGKIYVDPRIATAETPIHEYDHLWCEMKRQTAPEEWNEIKQVMLNDEVVKPIIDRVKRDYEELTKEGREDDFVEEVITQFSGKRGSERLREVAEEVAKENGGIFGKAEAITAMQRLKSILNQFWEGVARMMGWKYRNANQIADRMMSDMLNGVDPTKIIKDFADSKINEMKAYHGSASEFDKFDHTKIGSGEGQAVSGHGTYVTTSEGTARYYANVASDRRRKVVQEGGYTVDGKIVHDPALYRASEYLKKADGNVDEAIKACDHTIEVLNRHKDKNPFAALRGNGKSVAEEAMDYLIQEKDKPGTLGYQEEIIDKPDRQLYEVEIPDDTGKNYLDLDKKLTKAQKVKFRKAFDDALDNSEDADYWKKNRDIIDYDWKQVESPDAIGDTARGVMEQFLPSEKVSDIFSDMGYVGSKTKGSDGTTYIIYKDGDLQIKDRMKFQMVGKKGAAEADKTELFPQRTDDLRLAEEMEQAGKDAKAIKLASGWERGADGQWRYEIPDADVDVLSKYDAKVAEMKKAGVKNPQPIFRLGDLLGEDNELFKYYPKLKKMQVLFSDILPDGTAGLFDGSNIEINSKEVNRFNGDDLNNESVYGTLLHEVQHAIQDIEGFARGGNLHTSTTEAGINAIIANKEAERARIKTELDAINKILSSSPEEKKDYADLVGRTVGDYMFHLEMEAANLAQKSDNIKYYIEKIKRDNAPSMTDAKDLYHRLAGEVEARNVTSRMALNDIGKRQTLATVTEDVPREDQVIIMSDGTAMNINDIKPVGTGDFGEIYDQFKGKPKEAVDFLIKKKGGDLLGVFHRDEVGDIDLVWGYSPNPYKGKGLSHIIKKHIDTLHDFKDVDELTAVLDDVVNNGKMNDEYAIEKDGYRVVISKEKDGKRWVLTAFDNSKTQKEKASRTSLNTPSVDNGEGAVSPDAYLSDGKDTKNINSFQENSEKSSDEAPKFQRVGSPEPEMTPEERQYWNQWDKAMKKWREKNAIPDDMTQVPEKPRFQQGESAMDYAKRLVEWNRQKSLWQTAPKLEDYRKVREDKDVLEAARENEKRYPDSPSAKMRRAAAEFQRIRSAMSRQKAYDKATVKAVTDFAQEFMKLGFGDNLSRGEMERMLSSVKNATGAKDIKKEVDNIMNILIDNHLRNLDQRVQKLSSVKELSKTVQGVEKQGKLELKGQRMIQAFREAREKRMTVDQIRERMADVSEKMNRNDEGAPMWEQEYEGLSIALQYAENIEGSRQEWGELDQIYKDAVKEYKTSGRSYKAQQELLESIDQAMQENKIERIGLFGDIIGRLEGNISESMQGAKEFVEREKQRIKHIQDIANYDLAGKSMSAFHQSDWKKRLSNGTAARFFLSPLATFEQMLRQFGARNANGEGYLYDHFMRSWIDSVDRSYVNEQKAKEELDEKAREVFGDKVKRWSDLYELERRRPKMEVTISDQGEDRTFTLNQGNLLYIYMADKMTDGRMKLRKMGIDEEHIDAIKDFLDPRIRELGDWIQNEYLPKKRTGYNKVHERMFGAPMAAIDNYFPIKILGDARIQEQDVANMADQDAVLPSTITGSIVKRRKNALPLDILGTDALSLAVEHIEDMERWAAQAEWNKDVNTLLSYTTFRNKVKNMNTIYGSGDQLWNTFADTARMAAGTYRPKVKPGSVDKAISNIAKGVTAAKINFRVYTAFKQILSAPAFLHDTNLGTFVKNSVNPYGSWKWAMENMPVFQKRWKSRQVGDTRLMDDPTDWKIWKTNVVQLATRMGMSPNALVDGVTCAVGAKSIYETRYKQYKDIGASDEVARKRALQDAEIGYNLTQQSSEGAFVSAIQKDRTVAANMLSVFRNSSMAYTRQWVDAARNLRHRAQKGYKEDSIRFMAGQLEQRFDLEPDEAKKMAEAQYARAARHDVARLLNMMFGVTTAWNLGASLPYLLFGDDDHTKKEMVEDAMIKGFVAGPTEGLAAGNLYSDFIGRTVASEETRKTVKNDGWGAGIDAALKHGGDYEVNPLPLMADIQSMIKKMGYDKYAAAQDVFNICMQSAVGVNPQTFTDMWNACMDYGNPGWMPFTKDVGNDDLANSKEIALFIMRVLNAPTSSWRNKYIDELGMNVEDAKKLPYEEMARRYANYKHWKDAPIMGWLRDDESRAAKMEKIQKQFDNAVTERMERLTDEELMHNVARSESPEEKRRYAKIIAQRLGVTPGEDSQKADEKKEWYQKLYQQKMSYEDIKEDEMLADKYKNLENYYKEKYEEAARQSAVDEQEFIKANKEWKNRIDEAKKEVKKRMEWIRGGKWSTPSGKKGNSKNATLQASGKKQLETSDNSEEIMRNIRQWRKEALEILMRAEADQ